MEIVGYRLTTNENTWVTVDVKVNGVIVPVGRIDPSWSKEEILNHLESKKEEILSIASKKEVSEWQPRT